MTTTDTPRTDFCPHCGSGQKFSPTSEHYGIDIEYYCNSAVYDDGEIIGSEFCSERVARKKAEAEVERLKGIVKAQQDELEAISFALGTNEGHSSVDHISTLMAEVERLKNALESI